MWHELLPVLALATSHPRTRAWIIRWAIVLAIAADGFFFRRRRGGRR
jgi:hypothetical protein